MPNTDDNFARIESYLFGTLSPEERQSFEQELTENEALAREVNIHRAEHRAMQIMLQQELRANIENWKTEKQQAAPAAMPAMKMSYRRIFTRLAAACLVLIAGFWYFMRDTPDKLFSRTEIAMRAAPGELPPMLANARLSMNDKQYETALRQLDQVNDDDYSWDISMMRGECHYWLRNYEEAARQFEPLVNNPINSSAGQLAEYYLLLTYWAKHDNVKGKILLEKILNTPGHEFQEQAGKLKGRF